MFNIEEMKKKAQSNELKTSSAEGAQGGGISVGEGQFLCTLKSCEIKEGYQDKTKRNLVFSCEVTEVIDGEDCVGGKFNWYFTGFPANEEQAERLVGDLVKLMEIQDIDSMKLFEDVEAGDSILDVYANATALLVRPVSKGKIVPFGLGRSRQPKNPKYFNHYMIADSDAAKTEVSNAKASAKSAAAASSSSEEEAF